MLNGIDPIIIFHFKNKTTDNSSLLAQFIEAPSIPIYLSEKLTGLYVDSESHHIDIETNTNTLASGDQPQVNQKAIGSNVGINLIASSDSIGLTLLMSMADLILPKVTSQEYSITYMHGATAIFDGLLHSFSVEQDANSTLYNIHIELSKSNSKKTTQSNDTKTVPKIEGTINLSEAS
jgi:hypothetical protein